MKTMRDELEEQMEKQKSIQKEVMERGRERITCTLCEENICMMSMYYRGLYTASE